ncbi:39438_t:CDS:10, partial [Gigaspora margarita]
IITKQVGHDKLYTNFKKYFEKDGVVKRHQFGRWIFMITDPVIAKNILLQTDVYPKVKMEEFLPNSSFAEYLGTNVAFSSGDVWKRHRYIYISFFFAVAKADKTALKMMDILETIDKKPIEIKSLMQRFTLDVLGKVAFGFDFNNLDNPDNVYVKAYNDVQKIIMDPISILFRTERIPVIRQKNLKKVDKLSNLFKEIIKEKHKALAAGKSRGDLLELMLNANENQDNQMLSDTELRHNMAVFMLAGHDTTSNALSTLLYVLSTHKDVQENAREEVLRVLGDNLIPSTEQHKSLKYLNMVIYENLRMYPPASTLIFRELTEDLKFKDFVIPAGSLLELFIYGIHHSSKLWDKPEEFLPERFEKENANSENYSWLAFGGGSRMLVPGK